MYEELISELQEKYEMADGWLERTEIEGEIEDLKVRMGQILPPKPIDSPYECFNCGS